jgi:hypothetical protein
MTAPVTDCNWIETQMKDDVFKSLARSKGDLAGVFEYDRETWYFYLYDQTRGNGVRVLGSLHICTGDVDFAGRDVVVAWDLTGDKVGLFICGVLWAVFDHKNRNEFGGNYKSRGKPNIPPEVWPH